MLTLALPLLLLAGSADETPANLTNARLQTHSAAAGLEAAFRPLAREAGPAWIGYAVPVLGRHQMCCYRSTDEIGTATPGCNVESGEGAYTIRGGKSARAWEHAPDFLVLFRVENGRVDRIRSLSRGCGLDVGGRPFHWITGVRSAESLELLESMVGTDVGTSKRKGKGGMDEPAIAAIAMHADPGADAILERLVATRQPIGVRKQAAFWMGNSRGRPGYETLRRLVADDASPELREHAVFALSQSDVPEAVDTMIAVGRGDADPQVRGQALFWLSQKAGRKAAAAITRAIEDDPETAVKKKAVFALSQLPKEEGVPLLIDLARKHANPAVRKQAMFWLGQSEDPRALAFFAEILSRD
jgi:HEAT repeat protein